jgi:hypothetical protein
MHRTRQAHFTRMRDWPARDRHAFAELLTCFTA